VHGSRIGADEEVDAAEEGGEFLEVGFGDERDGDGGHGRQLLRLGQLTRSPDNKNARLIAAGQAVRQPGEPLQRPALRRPAAGKIERHHPLSLQLRLAPEGLRPLFSGPASGQREAARDHGDAEMGESVKMPLRLMHLVSAGGDDDVVGPAAHAVIIAHPPGGPAPARDQGAAGIAEKIEDQIVFAAADPLQEGKVGPELVAQRHPGDSRAFEDHDRIELRMAGNHIPRSRFGEKVDRGIRKGPAQIVDDDGGKHHIADRPQLDDQYAAHPAGIEQTLRSPGPLHVFRNALLPDFISVSGRR